MTKRSRKKDPHLKREAKKYEYPVPSREFITEHLEDSGEPLTFAQLMSAFSLKTPEEKEEDIAM